MCCTLCTATDFVYSLYQTGSVHVTLFQFTVGLLKYKYKVNICFVWCLVAAGLGIISLDSS